MHLRCCCFKLLYVHARPSRGVPARWRLGSGPAAGPRRTPKIYTCIHAQTLRYHPCMHELRETIHACWSTGMKSATSLMHGPLTQGSSRGHAVQWREFEAKQLGPAGIRQRGRSRDHAQHTTAAAVSAGSPTSTQLQPYHTSPLQRAGGASARTGSGTAQSHMAMHGPSSQPRSTNALQHVATGDGAAWHVHHFRPLARALEPVPLLDD